MLTTITYWCSKLGVCTFHEMTKWISHKALQWKSFQDNQFSRKWKIPKENLFQTNYTTILPKTRHAMWSMPKKKRLDMQTKTFQTCVIEVKSIEGP